MWRHLIRTLLVGFVALAGCATSRQEPRVLAADEAARCSDESLATTARIAGGANVQRVEPLYGIVASSYNGAESRLRGAKLHLRSAGGMNSESLTHVLYCHEAAEVLHGDDASPYWIPDGWVQITVKYEADDYVVELEGHDINEAKRILARAQAGYR